MNARLAWCAGLSLSVTLVASAAWGQAKNPTKSLNPANDQLLASSPADRAAKLARAVGNWCVGTETFLMGVSNTGRGQGYAYWSLRCVDGTTWAVQVDPFAGVTAIDCGSFKEQATGKECFKKF